MYNLWIIYIKWILYRYKFDNKDSIINLDIYNSKWQNLINLALEDDYNKRVNIEEIYNYISNEILINVRDLNIQNEKKWKKWNNLYL